MRQSTPSTSPQDVITPSLGSICAALSVQSSEVPSLVIFQIWVGKELPLGQSVNRSPLARAW